MEEGRTAYLGVAPVPAPPPRPRDPRFPSDGFAGGVGLGVAAVCPPVIGLGVVPPVRLIDGLLAISFFTGGVGGCRESVC